VARWNGTVGTPCPARNYKASRSEEGRWPVAGCVGRASFSVVRRRSDYQAGCPCIVPPLRFSTWIAPLYPWVLRLLKMTCEKGDLSLAPMRRGRASHRSFMSPMGSTMHLVHASGRLPRYKVSKCAEESLWEMRGPVASDDAVRNHPMKAPPLTSITAPVV
jgi:hypothetical protein